MAGALVHYRFENVAIDFFGKLINTKKQATPISNTVILGTNSGQFYQIIAIVKTVLSQEFFGLISIRTRRQCKAKIIPSEVTC